jgi:lipopolysaccharide transport system ATP-binding protein
VVVRLERPVPGRSTHHSLSGPDLAFRYSCCLPQQSRAGKVASALRVESDGRCGRRFSLGFGGQRTTAWDVLVCLHIDGGRDFDKRALLFPPHGSNVCRRGVEMTRGGMNSAVIRVDELSKCYRLGQKKLKKNLGELLSDSVRNRFRRFSNLNRQGSSKGTNPADEILWALKSVSFEVGQGEVVGIIGRNGAGKSTLLKILCRITDLTEGYVEIHGRIGSLLEVGTGFHGDLTGRENIYLGGAVLGMRKAEISRKFDEIVAFAEIDQFLDTPVKRYSSGMYMRLAFAVAAHLEPEILIVDEVLAVGDAAFQKKCLGKMSEVAHEGRTILFVSHNMAAVKTLCQRGIFLKNGTISCDATATEAVGTYLRSLEQAASQDLAVRTERTGKGQVRLSRVDACTGDADSSPILMTGRSARFVFYLTKMVPKLTCVFTIYNHLGEPVANFNSAIHSPEDSHDLALDTKLICHLDELSLVPGQYRINVAILSEEQLQDHVEAAAIFDVEPGTCRGRPVAKDTGYGNVSMHHRWTLPGEV